MMGTDLGKTCQPVGTPPTDGMALAVDPVNAQTIFTSGAAGTYKSTDGGKNWSEVYAFNVTGQPYPGSVVIDPGAPLRSVDAGETWTPTGVTASQLQADPARGTYGRVARLRGLTGG
jgi:hypothetical protein